MLTTAAIDGEPPMGTYEGLDDDALSVDYSSPALLHLLQGLTRLQLNVADQECRRPFWMGLACLTTLRYLEVNNVDVAGFGGLSRLSSCRQLTHLRICCENWSLLDVEVQVRSESRLGLLDPYVEAAAVPAMHAPSTCSRHAMHVTPVCCTCNRDAPYVSQLCECCLVQHVCMSVYASVSPGRTQAQGPRPSTSLRLIHWGAAR